MITRTHTTAGLLALAALLASCRSSSQDAPTETSARHTEMSTTPKANDNALAGTKSSGNKVSETKATANKPVETKPMESKSTEAKADAQKIKSEAKDAPTADVTVRAKVGEAAPAFALKDLDGKEHSLAQYKGKTVVLEWFNPQCPFCVYAYGDGPLKTMPERYMADGIVWLSINSGSPESKSNGEVNRPFVTEHGLKAPILVDSTGIVGRSYGAKSTPHMFVIDPQGVLVYAGGLDNSPLGKVADGATPVNYVDAAIADLKAGKPVTTSTTKWYGCSVKYAKP